MIKTIDNKTEKLGDDLKSTISNGCKLSVAAGIFSIYGYDSLKTALGKTDKFRFIFTDPLFI